MIPTPDDLLFADLQGHRRQVQEIAEDGLEADYSSRVPDLERLLHEGDLYHQQLACYLLTAWGHRAGFEKLIAWAEQFGRASRDARRPLPGQRDDADSAFDMLADALVTSTYLEERQDLAELQRSAAATLLAIYSEAFIGNAFVMLFGARPGLRRQLAPQIDGAIGRCLDAITAEPAERGLDLGVRTASLIAPLVREHPERAALHARRLIELQPKNARMLYELAHALGAGEDDETAEILQQMESLAPAGSSAAEAVRQATLRRALT